MYIKNGNLFNILNSLKEIYFDDIKFTFLAHSHQAINQYNGSFTEKSKIHSEKVK
jgi:hypothetical protein